MALALTRKVREKVGDFDYGVWALEGLATGANTLSAGSFGMTKAFVVCACAATQATLSATGTSLTTISTAENTRVGGPIVITGIESGDAVILEVMGW